MVRSDRDGGVAGAARQFALRHRVLLLSLTLSIIGIATGLTTANALLGGASLGDAALILIGAVLAGICSLAHTRHPALAFLTAVAPLPGLAWASPMNADAALCIVPVLAYVFAYGVAVMQTQNILIRTLDGGTAEPPYKPFAATVGLMAALLLLWFWRSTMSVAAFQAVLDVVLASVSALVVIPIGALVLHFDEGFVAVANRARERRQRLLERVAVIATPRWGMSIAGIALIFLALAWFGAEPEFSYVNLANGKLLFAVSLALIFALSSSVCNGWREGFGATVAACVVGLSVLWAYASLGKMPLMSLIGILQLISLALFFSFCGARRAAAYRRLGDDPAIAQLRAVEELGGPQFFAIIGGIAALLPIVALHPTHVTFIVALIFSMAGVLGFAPAMATACSMLVPRRRSLEALYGRNKK